MSTHGTPPRLGLAAASGVNSGALKNIPALPIMTTTMPFLVRDMRSQSFCVVLQFESVTGLTEPTIWKIADATKAALRNRCQGEAILLRSYRSELGLSVCDRYVNANL
ncbi:hypothetical protein [Mycolicibacterium sp. 018/SC-01/001]|uniref:hypothetical protein n=1 Tax=Mycolicibacterium sp. 018/SC-01/001 TaxID=2592069 RepID=UPI002105DA86|nr:hypothetical protein [Mycolicibacterium sp. 018/SC-01/001]